MVWGVNGYAKDEPLSLAQITFPEASVVNFPPFVKAEQFAVERVRPPPVIRRPPANVEVAVVVEMLRAPACNPPKKVLVPMRPWEYMKPVVVAEPPKRELP